MAPGTGPAILGRSPVRARGAPGIASAPVLALTFNNSPLRLGACASGPSSCCACLRCSPVRRSRTRSMHSRFIVASACTANRFFGPAVRNTRAGAGYECICPGRRFQRGVRRFAGSTAPGHRRCIRSPRRQPACRTDPLARDGSRLRAHHVAFAGGVAEAAADRRRVHARGGSAVRGHPFRTATSHDRRRARRRLQRCGVASDRLRRFHQRCRWHDPRFRPRRIRRLLVADVLRIQAAPRFRP